MEEDEGEGHPPDQVIGGEGDPEPRRHLTPEEAVEITDRANDRLVGRLHQDRDFLLVTPADRRIGHEVLIAKKDSSGAKAGEIVVVRLLAQPQADTEGESRYSPPVGRVEQVLGNATDPGMEIEIALRKHDLPFEFSETALRLAGRLGATVRSSDLVAREDIRSLPLLTIDGETARDFDDAVYCSKAGRNHRLLVAIADVSHYVQHGDALDRDARMRGNSVYFPRRVIPMLPESLSNGLCSLNPDVDRLCVVCDMLITPAGAIKSYRFYPAVMRSHARLTYTAVAAALTGSSPDWPGGMDLLPHLRSLENVYRALFNARVKRGGIDFETQETHFVFDEAGQVKIGRAHV